MDKRKWDRLKEIQDEMLNLLHEADQILRNNAEKHVYNRAKSYWLANVQIGLTDDHDYLGGAGVSMDNTINECEPDVHECTNCGSEIDDERDFVVCSGCGEDFCHDCIDEDAPNCNAHRIA